MATARGLKCGEIGTCGKTLAQRETNALGCSPLDGAITVDRRSTPPCHQFLFNSTLTVDRSNAPARARPRGARLVVVLVRATPRTLYANRSNISKPSGERPSPSSTLMPDRTSGLTKRRFALRVSTAPSIRAIIRLQHTRSRRSEPQWHPQVPQDDPLFSNEDAVP